MRVLASALVLATGVSVAGIDIATAQVSPRFPQTQPLPPQAPPPPPGIAPGVAPRDYFADKVARCMHYGATQGVRPGDIAQYTRECVNAQ